MNNIENLKLLNLTDYEIKVYAQLLKVPQSGVTELSQKANVSRGKIYGVLKSLEKKGFCFIVADKKKTYKAIAPQIAIQKQIRMLKSDWERKESLLKDTAEDLQKIFRNVKAMDTPEHYFQVLPTPAAISEAVSKYQINSKELIRVFMKNPIVTDESEEDAEKRIKSQIEKKVKIKQIFEFGTEDFTDYKESVFDARQEGADFEIKIAKKLPIKLVIFDENHALFSIKKETKSAENYSMMSVSNTYLTTALVELFEFYWRDAVSLEDFIEQNLEEKWEKELLKNI